MITDQQLSEVRESMLKFAHLQLNDNQYVEDVVQEALVEALKNKKSFKGKSAFSTWIFAILKYKIIDHINKNKPYNAISELNDSKVSSEHYFDKYSHWQPQCAPQKWQKTESAMEDDRFWMVFNSCLDNLPPIQAKIFMMKEYLGYSSQEVCKYHYITTSNLHVILYRARIQLQSCLTRKWFKECH